MDGWHLHRQLKLYCDLRPDALVVVQVFNFGGASDFYYESAENAIA